VNGFSFNLNDFENIYVVGGGKAACSMAQALEDIFGGHLTDGIVNIPHGTCRKTRTIALHEASHPVPDQGGVEGTRQMIALAEKAQEKDLVICLISGGGSSLMPLPRDNISLEDKQELTKALLKSGAAIDEINIVRKHLSDFKGGWLAKKAYPATVLNLVLSDVIDDKLDSIASGPTYPDPSTFAQAGKIMKRYGLDKNVLPSVSKLFSDGTRGIIPETPKPDDEAFKKVFNVIVGNNKVAINAACDCLKTDGLSTLLLPDLMIGEAKDFGYAFSNFANDISVFGKPFSKPVGVVAGGETTVRVVGTGLGGRNQEIALSAALNLKDIDGCVLASIGTDGIDGPTDAAGAIVDSSTIRRAAKMGLNPKAFLNDNDSYSIFSQLGDLVITGSTGTNVNDISLIVIL
jgi:glycerate 2-kinase